MSSAKSSYDSQILRALIDSIDLQKKATNEGFEKLTNSIDQFALSIAQLTAQQKATATNLDKVSDNLDKVADSLSGHLALSRSQSENIAELTKLATRLIANH